MEVSRDGYVEAQEISWMIMGQSEGESDESSHPTKKKKVTRKEHIEERAQAFAPQELLFCPPSLQSIVSKRYHLREMLEVVPRSALRSDNRSLKLDTSKEGQSSSSGSGSGERNLSCPFSRHHNADPRNIPAVQEERQAELTHFDDVISSKPPFNCLKSSLSYNGSFHSYCFSPLSLFPSSWNRDRCDILHCSPLPEQLFISA